MAVKNLLIKNNTYDGVRAVITASQSGTIYYYYAEARGDRYYYTITGSTASPTLETATFNTYLSFTMSGAQTYTLDIIPMKGGDTAMLDIHATAINASGSKGYVARAFGGFRHTGSALSIIGSTIDYNVKTDFASTMGMTFSAAGTQSVRMTLVGQTSEVIDWDIYLQYAKGYHTLTTGGGGGGGGGAGPADPWYPTPPSA